VKTAIIGIGNILFKDEGLGVYAAKYLAANYRFDKNVEIIDGGTLGFKLMRYYQEYDKVLIFDTVSIEDTPGSIYNIPSDVLLGLGAYRKTAHEVEVVEMLEICSLLEKIAKTNIIGMVPEDIENVEIALSKSIKDNFPNLIDAALAELRSDGIIYEETPTLSLEEIIFQYQNPTMADAATL